MKNVPPSEVKAKQIEEMIREGNGWKTGEELLSNIVRLSTERVIQELLEHEQDEVIGVKRYDRDGTREGYRNGYKRRKLKTAEGVMELQVPQYRGLDNPHNQGLWNHLSRRSEVLEAIVTEMYARGLSVRDVEEAMMAATGAFVVSDTVVSEVTEKLYEQYEVFKQRDLSGFDIAYLFLDAIYEPLRRYGNKQAVCCAWGMSTDGSRVLLGLKTGNAEDIDTVMDFLRDMVGRGLKTPLTVTTDGALGLTKAVDQMWPRSLRIRCWFHKMQNLQGKVPPEAWPEFKAMVVDIRDAPTYEKGKERLEMLVKTMKHQFPEACQCLVDDMEASLNHLRVPIDHRIWVRTTNLVERSFEEERRRTKIIPHLWDEKSLVKLVFATLIRIGDKWKKRAFHSFELAQLRQLKMELRIDTSDDEPVKHSSSKRRSAGYVAV